MQNKENHYSSLVIQNPKDCIHYVMNLFKLEVYDEFDNALFTVNDPRKSLLYFIFRKDQYTKFSIYRTLYYLKVQNIEVTWVVGLCIRMCDILERYGIRKVNEPKEIIFYDYFLPDDAVLNLKLNIVDSSEFLEQLDLHLSKIFYCRIDIIRAFFLRLLNYDDETLELRFIFVVFNNEIVRICVLCINDSVAHFYNDDGALPIYSGVRGIEIQMVLGRIKISKKFESKYIIAHFMKLSVNLYKRLGFRILYTSHLHTSLSQSLR